MFIFFLLSLCFAEQTTYTIGSQSQIVIKLDKEKLEQNILNKCIDAKIFSFNITKENDLLKCNLYKTSDCKEPALVSIDMTETVKDLPPIQEEITIENDVKLTLGLPYGCLLKYLPEITENSKNEFNYEFVHTQFGVDVHSFSEGECEGIDKIVEIFSNNAELIQGKVKTILTEANLSVDKVKEYAKGAVNMFETIKKELYEYKEKLPTLADEYLYEFNGKVMKIYKIVEENGKKYFKYIQDAVIPKFENVIGKLVDDYGKIFNVTAECDPITGKSFGYYDGKLQMTVSDKCKFNDNDFDLNFRLNISSILSNDKSMWIDDMIYYFTEVNDYAKDLSTKTKAIVESFGSNMEFTLNECKPMEFGQVLSSFSDIVIEQFSDYENVQEVIREVLEKAEDINKEVSKLVRKIQVILPWFKLPTYGYKIGMLKTGIEGKNYATYCFYNEQDCTTSPIFEFVIGVVKDVDVKEIETGFELTKYMEKESCSSKKGEDGYYKEHVQIDVCVNGYKYSYENEEMKLVSCDNLKKSTDDDNTVYKCETCVECLKQKGVVKGDYAYVTCGSSSIFVLLIVLMFFILF